MPLNKEQKAEILNSLVEQMKDAKSIIFANYQGLSVKDLKELRDNMRTKGVSFQISKKTIIKLAAKEAGYSESIPDDALEGPIGAAFSMEDELSGAKLLFDFAKKHQQLQLKGGLFEGRVVGVSEVNELAQLPSKEELVTKLLYVLKSPISGFHGVLNNTLAGFVRALNAIKERNEQAA